MYLWKTTHLCQPNVCQKLKTWFHTYVEPKWTQGFWAKVFATLKEVNVVYKCFVGSLPNIEAFQLLFVGCLTHDSTKVPTSTFKSRHHQKKASPFFPLPQPPHHELLLLSWPLQSLNSLTPTTFIFGKAGGTLEYWWSIAGH
jgi:hypothetical protein